MVKTVIFVIILIAVIVLQITFVALALIHHYYPTLLELHAPIVSQLQAANIAKMVYVNNVWQLIN